MFRKIIKKSKTRSEFYFFVHIPKTAGTSFRNGLEKKYKVACDYGEKSEQTSKVVSVNTYEKKDLYRLYEQLLQQKFDWLSGHVFTAKYQPLLNPRNIITFVRQPIERLYSSYNHYCLHLGYKESFKNYIQDKRFINSQSRFLGGIPIELIGNIGITEKYADSLALINKKLKNKVEYLEKNVRKNEKVDFSDHLDLLRQLNKLDLELYNKAIWLHEQRMTLNSEWVHATASINSNNNLQGLAWYETSDDAVKLDIYCNNNFIACITANLYYKGKIPAVFPRKRYVLYSYNLNDIAEKGAEITLKVSKTGQVINYEKFVINKH